MSRCVPVDGSAVPLATLSERAVGRFVDASVAIAVELAVIVPFSLLLWLRGWGHDWGYGRPSLGGRDAIGAPLWLDPVRDSARLTRTQGCHSMQLPPTARTNLIEAASHNTVEATTAFSAAPMR